MDTSKANLINFLVASEKGGIERQEKVGQIALVNGMDLPKSVYGATRDQLSELGFRFGVDIDDLFVDCQLPAGWSKVATDHPLWSSVLDSGGRKRASIFYKAAFYDRVADMHMICRFNINSFLPGSDEEHIRVAVTDCDVVVKDLGEVALGSRVEREALVEAAREWLVASYPDWMNPLSYW